MNFLHNGIVGGILQNRMTVGVVADLMALRGHPAQKVFVAGNLLTNEEKGGADAPGLQSIQ